MSPSPLAERAERVSLDSLGPWQRWSWVPGRGFGRSAGRVGSSGTQGAVWHCMAKPPQKVGEADFSSLSFQGVSAMPEASPSTGHSDAGAVTGAT